MPYQPNIIWVIILWIWSILGTFGCILGWWFSITWSYGEGGCIPKREQDKIHFVGVGEIIFNTIGIICLWFMVFVCNLLCHYFAGS